MLGTGTQARISRELVTVPIKEGHAAFWADELVIVSDSTDPHADPPKAARIMLAGNRIVISTITAEQVAKLVRQALQGGA